MKRDNRLVPLSWNHHDGLVFAKRLREAIEDGSQTVEFLAQAVRNLWQDDLTAHFGAEEDILAPAALETGDEACEEAFVQMFEEHATIRSLVREIGEEANEAALAAMLTTFADRLTAHIRFEERDLFEKAQQALPETTLERIESAIKAAAPPSRACPIPPRER